VLLKEVSLSHTLGEEVVSDAHGGEVARESAVVLLAQVFGGGCEEEGVDRAAVQKVGLRQGAGDEVPELVREGDDGHFSRLSTRSSTFAKKD
jgi:hypothetical protein